VNAKEVAYVSGIASGDLCSIGSIGSTGAPAP
jgi:hypothetical protein